MTAPTLRPDYSPDGTTMKAWADIWRMLDADEWTPLAAVFSRVLALHPSLKRKTIDVVIREARRNQLIQRRGGYSHKTGRDTREIRRHPKATAEETHPA